MADPIYKTEISMQNVHHRRYRHRAWIAFIAVMIVLIVAIIIILDLFRLKTQNPKSVIGPAYTQNIDGPKIYRSAYFQFSDTASWSYASGDSTANKTTFLLNSGGVPADSVTVYVNQTPTQDNLATTHVVPVGVVDQNSFTVGAISDACGTLYKPTDLKRIRMISLSNTSMLCVPDSPDFTAVAAQVGGNYNLALKRSNGQIANYIIIFDDLSVNPDGAPFNNFLKTFQAL